MHRIEIFLHHPSRFYFDKSICFSPSSGLTRDLLSNISRWPLRNWNFREMYRYVCILLDLLSLVRDFRTRGRRLKYVVFGVISVDVCWGIVVASLSRYFRRHITECFNHLPEHSSVNTKVYNLVITRLWITSLHWVMNSFVVQRGGSQTFKYATSFGQFFNFSDLENTNFFFFFGFICHGQYK